MHCASFEPDITFCRRHELWPPCWNNCGLNPQTFPFSQDQHQKRHSITSTQHFPHLIPGCGMCCVHKAWLCYPQSAKLTTSTTKIWQRVRNMCDLYHWHHFITDSYFSAGECSKITKAFDLILLLFLVWSYKHACASHKAKPSEIGLETKAFQPLNFCQFDFASMSDLCSVLARAMWANVARFDVNVSLLYTQPGYILHRNIWGLLTLQSIFTESNHWNEIIISIF